MSATKNPPQSEVLFTAKEVDNLIQKTAAEMSRHMGESLPLDGSGTAPLLVGVLKGAFIFMADLVRKIDRAVELDFVKVSSYGQGTQTSGSVKLEFAPKSVAGRDVYVVDEIIDTGRTLLFLKDYFEQQGARSVKVVVLLDKKSRREVEMEADFVGIEIPDEFVVGFGLDWGEKYRDLADVRYIVQP